jgi:hypothetical protein
VGAELMEAYRPSNASVCIDEDIIWRRTGIR